MITAREQAKRWREISVIALDAAEQLKASGNFRGCANRAYYSAYQAATAISIEHGDEASFPLGWHNPAHDQLPNLVMNNGDLPIETRRRIASHLRFLRTIREDADYRPGLTLDRQTALECLHRASTVLELLGVNNNGT